MFPQKHLISSSFNSPPHTLTFWYESIVFCGATTIGVKSDLCDRCFATTSWSIEGPTTRTSGEAPTAVEEEVNEAEGRSPKREDAAGAVNADVEATARPMRTADSFVI